ncbi:MAG TPA: cysteine--1-D-myo-inosityl 2-amino-2-deoxy-alpha-D-glucopyranoside ligase, partial [Streptosporangiaceae bacterium]|nr:cysteine--1-D-myo-inosityl 2-amino-2-deoxy-alpha-D-glucopyranoside ligase [Streptosporangiaceae bacterium]
MYAWREPDVPSLPGRGGVVRIRDTASGELAPATAGHQAAIYACGITPYDATHIGHAATFLAWDLLVRALRDAGHDVRYVQNVTDVDDPLLERAHRDGDDWRELAGREVARYRTDMESLRVLPPTRLVGAVEAMPLIERFALALADRGALYELEGDQYFSRTTDPAFGSVSRLDLTTMLALSAERGGDPGRAGKKDPLDPLVWLAARPGEPSWESAFGAGRPGWHVECAAIATEYLGDRFDVQAGGTDLIFPHHEMSASHARVALGDGGAARAVFARRYAHAGMVRLAGEKMSKSLGNLVFVSSLLAGGADPMAVRLAILAHSYREDWDWTEPGLSAAADRLARWRAAVSSCLAAPASGESDPVPTGPAPSGAAASGPVPSGPAASGPVPSGESVLAGVRERLADDLDAVGALAVIDRWAGAVASATSLPADAAAAAALV